MQIKFLFGLINKAPLLLKQDEEVTCITLRNADIMGVEPGIGYRSNETHTVIYIYIYIYIRLCLFDVANNYLSRLTPTA